MNNEFIPMNRTYQPRGTIQIRSSSRYVGVITVNKLKGLDCTNRGGLLKVEQIVKPFYCHSSSYSQ